MTHFIELTTPQGEKFLANVSHILRVINNSGDKPNENTYISGLNNNGGIYVRESYEDIQKALYDKLRLHNPIIKL
jgi:hypothetical protein